MNGPTEHVEAELAQELPGVLANAAQAVHCLRMFPELLAEGDGAAGDLEAFVAALRRLQRRYTRNAERAMADLADTGRLMRERGLTHGR